MEMCMQSRQALQNSHHILRELEIRYPIEVDDTKTYLKLEQYPIEVDNTKTYKC